MHADLCRQLLANGTRFLSVTDRALGRTLKGLHKEFTDFHSQVSVNEQTAFELALAGALRAQRTACIVSSDRAYEALDSLTRSAHAGTVGGFLTVCLRETEEDAGPLGVLADLPFVCAEGLSSLARSIPYAYSLSEKHGLPVIVQVSLPWDPGGGAKIEERPFRAGTHGEPATSAPWLTVPSPLVNNAGKRTRALAAEPVFPRGLDHKIEFIRADFETFPGNRRIPKGKTGVITDSASRLNYFDDEVSALLLSTLHPLPVGLVQKFIDEMELVFLAEGPYPTIELQIPDRSKVIPQQFTRGPARRKHHETLCGLTVVRDILGPGSSINMARGMAQTQPEGKILAITFEDHFLHSGIPALVNTLDTSTSFVLLIMVNEREEEIRGAMEGFGFTNCFHISSARDIERFKDGGELTVLFCRGIV
jgi:TPP-dependent indolepyruvate ferredoxin oxidoreductase alpha subunit